LIVFLSPQTQLFLARLSVKDAQRGWVSRLSRSQDTEVEPSHLQYDNFETLLSKNRKAKLYSMSELIRLRLTSTRCSHYFYYWLAKNQSNNLTYFKASKRLIILPKMHFL
jgi:hypothetical protein